jgi:adenylylsulfate kinase-like enzyme
LKTNIATLIWITGLSGSGKTTIGKKVYEQIKKKKENIVFLDGDDFRKIIGNDSVYDPKGRPEVARKIHRMCKFLISQNINVVCATMSLYSEIHNLNRLEFKNYIEVFIDCDIKELIQRDSKGLYSQAIKGELENVVGINMAYDKPKFCELIINNSEKNNLDKKVGEILNLI